MITNKWAGNRTRAFATRKVAPSHHSVLHDVHFSLQRKASRTCRCPVNGEVVPLPNSFFTMRLGRLSKNYESLDVS
jgi:hypothetical protein